MVQLPSAVHELLHQPHERFHLSKNRRNSLIVVQCQNEERCIGSRVMSYYEQWVLVQRADSTHSTLINHDALDLKASGRSGASSTIMER